MGRTSMKAVLYDKSNSSDVLAVRDVEKPMMLDNEVLVKIVSVSINAADYRSMRMGIIPKRKIFGSDIAGVVAEAGSNTKKFKVRDEVFGDISDCGFGGFAEYVSVPEIKLALKPKDVSFVDAASVPMASVTALQGLRDLGKIQPGQKVLIYGAGGGVGNFAVQLSKYFGTEVTAVCGPNNTGLVKSLGADDVIDYCKQDLNEIDGHFDLIMAVNGNRPLSFYRRLLSPNGICVIVGGSLSQVLKTMLFGAILSIGGRKIRVLAGKPNAEDLEFIIKLVQRGVIKPVIDRRYPLQETAKAMSYLGEGHARGKVVINISN